MTMNVNQMVLGLSSRVVFARCGHAKSETTTNERRRSPTRIKIMHSRSERGEGELRASGLFSRLSRATATSSVVCQWSKVRRRSIFMDFYCNSRREAGYRRWVGEPDRYWNAKHNAGHATFSFFFFFSSNKVFERRKQTRPRGTKIPRRS